MSVKCTQCVTRTHAVEILQGATYASAMMAIREMEKFAMVVIDQNSFNYHFAVCLYIDINECETELHDCNENAICNNTIGNFVCSCKPSYFGNGKNCESK